MIAINGSLRLYVAELTYRECVWSTFIKVRAWLWWSWRPYFFLHRHLTFLFLHEERNVKCLEIKRTLHVARVWQRNAYRVYRHLGHVDVVTFDPFSKRIATSKHSWFCHERSTFFYATSICDAHIFSLSRTQYAITSATCSQQWKELLLWPTWRPNKKLHLIKTTDVFIRWTLSETIHDIVIFPPHTISYICARYLKRNHDCTKDKAYRGSCEWYYSWRITLRDIDRGRIWSETATAWGWASGAARTWGWARSRSGAARTRG